MFFLGEADLFSVTDCGYIYIYIYMLKPQSNWNKLNISLLKIMSLLEKAKLKAYLRTLG